MDGRSVRPTHPAHTNPYPDRHHHQRPLGRLFVHVRKPGACPFLGCTYVFARVRALTPHDWLFHTHIVPPRWYNRKQGGRSITVAVLLIYPIIPVPLYDCVVLGNLFQGWCTPCGSKGAAAMAAAAAGVGRGDRAPEQPPALGGRRVASRNFSSGGSLGQEPAWGSKKLCWLITERLHAVKGLNSFLGGRANGSYRGGSSVVVNPPASLFVTTYNMGPIKVRTTCHSAGSRSACSSRMDE